MLKVGLTGSIAVGKSFVCSVFAELGCHVLDADQTARDVVQPGSKGLEGVVSNFGSGILDSEGALDRKKLGKIVFGDKSKLQLLNSLLHPLIIEAQNQWMSDIDAFDSNAIAVIDAALMIESGGYLRFDELVVVWCESDIQLERLMKRDGIGVSEAKRRIDAQMPQEEKKRFGSFLINTSSGFDETRIETEAVFEELRRKAHSLSN